MSLNDKIEIKISGPKEKEMHLFLPWDANLEDWKNAFRLILTHQEFSLELIKEILPENEY